MLKNIFIKLQKYEAENKSICYVNNYIICTILYFNSQEKNMTRKPDVKIF